MLIKQIRALTLSILCLYSGAALANGFKNNTQDTVTVNVKTAGAKGDGATDDFDAINKVLKTNQGPLKMYFPAGRYRITRTLTTTYPGTVFTFDKGARLVIAGNLNGGIKIANDYCDVRNGYIEGNGQTADNDPNHGFGVMLFGASHCKIVNTTFDKVSGNNIAVYHNNTQGSSYNLIKNNTLINPAYSRLKNIDAGGIMLGYSGDNYFHTYNVVEGNTVDGNGVLAIGVGIIGHGKNNTFKNNVIKNCLRYGIIAYNHVYTTMTLQSTSILYNKVSNIGNVNSSEPWGMGIYLMQSHYSKVIGNTVSNTLLNTDNSNILPPGAISLNGCISSLVKDNSILNSQKFGIAISQSYNTNITNNIIDGVKKSGLYILNTSFNSITGNTIKNIGEYAVLGAFYYTGLPAFNYFNVEKYKRIVTGDSITISNNKFYCNSDKVFNIQGDNADPTKNNPGTLFRNSTITNNTFYRPSSSQDFMILNKFDKNTINTKGNRFLLKAN
ncbi:hypothetical protein FPZ42_01930 [Mucilaginibacter achroorhodeus]|uniref:Uncharacterized protein n=1 Tax=Mucilaginibacter achroorhodeus TaxID=2599294 RepID=A0A563U9J2_9SPHI|nr:right-handed parallel beta-helix repeat-containing protein [Mucilaginibacter achroorhodeus]TWR28000.1 hypothetical protein FPZ42_01930 [Mucilaginibacter achroorhodeus]